MFERLVPITIALTTFVAWEFFLYKPQNFLAVFIGMVVIYLILLFKYNDYNLLDKDYWLLLAPSLILFISSSLLLLLLTNTYVLQFIVILVSLTLYYYIKYTYFFLKRITQYIPLSLERSSSYLGIINFLFVAIVIFALINFLNARLWYMAIIIVIFTFINTYQFFWINKISKRLVYLASILISILMLEFFWAVTFFPVSHFVSGLVLAILYYILVNLTLLQFFEKLENKIIRTYLLIGLSCMFIILLSAKWL